MTTSTSKLMLVGRSFFGDGAQRHPGEIVDTEGWRNIDALVRTRFLGPVPFGIVPHVRDDGRAFISEEAAGAAPVA